MQFNMITFLMVINTPVMVSYKQKLDAKERLIVAIVFNIFLGLNKVIHKGLGLSVL